MNEHALAERYMRLACLARDLIDGAEFDGEECRVPEYLLRRLERELRGQPQPSAAMFWMSTT